MFTYKFRHIFSFFCEGFQAFRSIPSYCREHYMIHDTIQMMIENAIKLNNLSKNKPLHLEIDAIGNGKIVVSFNLQLKSSKKASTESAFRNIIKRYELVTNKAVLIKKMKLHFP